MPARPIAPSSRVSAPSNASSSVEVRCSRAAVAPARPQPSIRSSARAAEAAGEGAESIAHWLAARSRLSAPPAAPRSAAAVPAPTEPRMATWCAPVAAGRRRVRSAPIRPATTIRRFRAFTVGVSRTALACATPGSPRTQLPGAVSEPGTPSPCRSPSSPKRAISRIRRPVHPCRRPDSRHRQTSPLIKARSHVKMRPPSRREGR